MTHLHHTKEKELLWRRMKKGAGFTFVNTHGNVVSEEDRARLHSFSIPPAWTDVMVSPDPLAHIQVIGVDARGRKQYIYHPDLVKRNQKQKFNQMVTFGERLPTLREAVSAHMREHTLTRDRVIATVVWLLEHTFIRIGNKTYATENQSYGLTTMRNRHVEVDGNTITFNFTGKSGIDHELDITNRRIADTIKACIDLPGYELFKYVDDEDNKRVVDSTDVNEYLQTYAGPDTSAKDFRTWGGSVLAGDSLYQKGNALTPFELKKNISEVVKTVARHLGNTKAVCRTYYIHPAIIESYKNDILVPHFSHSYGRTLNTKLSLSPEEYATWSLIKNM